MWPNVFPANSLTPAEALDLTDSMANVSRVGLLFQTLFNVDALLILQERTQQFPFLNLAYSSSFLRRLTTEALGIKRRGSRAERRPHHRRRRHTRVGYFFSLSAIVEISVAKWRRKSGIKASWDALDAEVWGGAAAAAAAVNQSAGGSGAWRCARVRVTSWLRSLFYLFFKYIIFFPPLIVYKLLMRLTFGEILGCFFIFI